MTVRGLRSWMLVAAGVAGGVAAGLLSAPFVTANAAGHAPAREAISSPHRKEAVPCPQVDLAAIRAEVRSAAREELAAFEESFRNSDAAPRADQNMGDPAHLAAVMRARAILEGAGVRRRWTEEDADSLRGELAGLPADRRIEMIRLLSVAINQGQVVPETDRLPF